MSGKKISLILMKIVGRFFILSEFRLKIQSGVLLNLCLKQKVYSALIISSV